MLFHETVVEKIIRLCDNYGGHREQTKLRAVIAELALSEYTQKEGVKVLVLTEDLEKAMQKVTSS
jgi:hypothetical protein